MAMRIPAYLSGANVVSNEARYGWDEWHVNDYFLAIDEEQFARLDTLSDAANLALAIGTGEWICHRFSALSHDPVPWDYLEAAWAAIVHPFYCEYVETIDDQWRGPIRGPLSLTISIVNDGIHCRETDPHEATRSCWMYNLATHVLPETDAFEAWLEACITRLEQTHPKDREQEDIWGDGPPFGRPVPREALDPERPYDPETAPELLDRFLQGLLQEENRFLAEPSDVSDAPGFDGTPYRYTSSE